MFPVFQNQQYTKWWRFFKEVVREKWQK